MRRTLIRYRRCRRKDLLPCVRLIMVSFNDVRRRAGKTPLPLRRPRQAPPMFISLLRREPESFYCAWHGKRLVGFAGAVNRGRQWYLAWLFVHPRYQGDGIGRKLVERIWREGRGVTHGLCTFGYSLQAVSFYGRLGMTPRDVIHMMRAPAERLTLPPESGLIVQEGLRPGDLRWIHDLEQRIRGYRRPPEWTYWSRSADHRIYVFRRRGRRIGYSMINTIGEIGPAGGLAPRDLLDVIFASLRLAVEQPFGRNVKQPRAQLFCPTDNVELYRRLLAAGMRNEEVLLFMADARYGDFSRYLPATLALF